MTTTTIPAAFNSLDNASYSPAGGDSINAWVGRQMARNDRWLSANIRRSHGTAWPLDQPLYNPVACEYVGLDLGCQAIDIGPGANTVQIYLRALAAVGNDFWMVGYCDSPNSPHPWASRQNAAPPRRLACAGTGARANYGPVTVIVPPGPGRRLVGLSVWVEILSNIGTPSVAAIPCYIPWYSTVAVVPPAVFPVLAFPAGKVARLVDTVTGLGLSGLHQVVRSTAGLVEVWPSFDMPEESTNLGLEMYDCAHVDLISRYIREAPLSGSWASSP